MFPYARLVNTVQMQLAKPNAKRLAIGLRIQSFETEAAVIPRVMHALEQLQERQTALRQPLTRSLWLPFITRWERIQQEMHLYGYPVHAYGAPNEPQVNHLLVAEPGPLPLLGEWQRFDVAFVPADPEAIELAKAHARATIVIGDLRSDLEALTDTVVHCDTFIPGETLPAWEWIFGEPEPIPELLDTIYWKWREERTDEHRTPDRALHNSLVVAHAHALANSTTQEEFKQTLIKVGVYPEADMLLFAGIDRAQGIPQGTPEALALS